MRHRPDDSYHRIGHYNGVCSLYLTRNSRGDHQKFYSWTEFVNTIIHKLVQDRTGEVSIVNACARHRQSQGLISRWNAKVEKCWHVISVRKEVVILHGQQGFHKSSVSFVLSLKHRCKDSGLITAMK